MLSARRRTQVSASSIETASKAMAMTAFVPAESELGAVFMGNSSPSLTAEEETLRNKIWDRAMRLDRFFNLWMRAAGQAILSATSVG